MKKLIVISQPYGPMASPLGQSRTLPKGSQPMERMKSASAKVRPVTITANRIGAIIPSRAASLIKRDLSIHPSTANLSGKIKQRYTDQRGQGLDIKNGSLSCQTAKDPRNQNATKKKQLYRKL